MNSTTQLEITPTVSPTLTAAVTPLPLSTEGTGSAPLILFFDTDFLQNADCATGDSIFIPKGTVLKGIRKVNSFAGFFTADTQRLRFDFHFSGDLHIKVGSFREGFSYCWTNDTTLSSKKSTIGKIECDLLPHNNYDIVWDIKDNYDTLEIHIQALEDSALFLLNSEKACAVGTEKTLTRLQNIIFPSLELCTELPLYFNLSDGTAYYSFTKSCVHLEKGDSIDFLTYFNSFSTNKWCTYTFVNNLFATFDFVGEFDLHFITYTPVLHATIAISRFQSDARSVATARLPNLHKEGILGVTLVARQQTTLWGGGYDTESQPKRDVILGIAITTYKREQEVIASVRRLTSSIANHPQYKERIQLTVVDNGNSLGAADLPGATLIPSPNFGGTGGFTRGLMHYKKQTQVTHCLFMDDDAKCDPEAVFKSIAFLQYVKDDSIAISGAMLSSNIMFMQWESGAWFDARCYQLHNNYDLRDRNNLYLNEQESKKKIYGAWWFFCFPITHTKYYSFPFFVRGDDIHFSYRNSFKVLTLNGISSWQEDFKTKESPQTLYFDMRSHIIHHLVLDGISNKPEKIIAMIWRFFIRFNASYQYDTANTITMALEDILSGVQYWTKNIDAANIRQKLKDTCQTEVFVPLNELGVKKDELVGPNEKSYCLASSVKPSFSKMLRKYSLNGHLLPSFLFDKRPNWFAFKYEVPSARLAYKKKRILVITNDKSKGYFLSFNRWKYFTNYFYFIKTTLKFILAFNKLKTEYRIFCSELEHNTFWEDIFSRKR